MISDAVLPAAVDDDEPLLSDARKKSTETPLDVLRRRRPRPTIGGCGCVIVRRTCRVGQCIRRIGSVEIRIVVLVWMAVQSVVRRGRVTGVLKGDVQSAREDRATRGLPHGDGEAVEVVLAVT